MGEPKPEKVAIVAEVREKFDSARAVMLTEYRGLSVSDLAALRGAMYEAGGEYKVYKNTMVRFAARELELDIEELLVGPTAIAFTGTRPDGGDGDAVGVAKALADFARANDKLVLKGGLLGDKILSADEIIALSKIAPRDELLARLAGGMAAPMQQFAALLAALPQKFAYAMKALIDQGGAPGAPESVPSAAEAEPEAPAAEAIEPEAPAAEEPAEATSETEDAVGEADAETPAVDESE